MSVFAAGNCYPAKLALNLFPLTLRRHMLITQMNTKSHTPLKLQANLRPENKQCPPLFLFFFLLPVLLRASLPHSFWRIRVCLALGQEWCQCLLQQNREGYRSSLKAASVRVRVCVCVSVTPASSKIDYSAGIYQEVRGVSMHVSETDRMRWILEGEGGATRIHTDPKQENPSKPLQRSKIIFRLNHS